MCTFDLFVTSFISLLVLVQTRIQERCIMVIVSSKQFKQKIFCKKSLKPTLLIFKNYSKQRSCFTNGFAKFISLEGWN